VIACGVFDGVHLGHQAIIERLHVLAKRYDATPVVVTFSPHPRAVLFPEQAPRLLTSNEQKVRLFYKFGVRATLFLEFDAAMADMNPADFVSAYLWSSEVSVRAVCIGSQWRFGRRGEGDTALLKSFGSGHGFEVCCVEELCLADGVVSSTRIRGAVQSGDFELCARLLGRAYTIFGYVSHGKGVGSTVLSCPTANLHNSWILMPPDGVYAARAVVRPEEDESRQCRGIVYIGKAPTMYCDKKDRQAILELHLFDCCGDLYEQPVEVELVRFIREDRKFSSVQLLKEQIQRDIVLAKGLV